VNFGLKWKVKDNKIVATEIHLPTQMSRTLCAPIALDMDKIAKMVFSKPPYEKIKDKLSGTEDLVVPWREIDRIMGVGPSYSRPRPQSANPQ
jgi:trehalose-6-phosphate synthase